MLIKTKMETIEIEHSVKKAMITHDLVTRDLPNDLCNTTCSMKMLKWPHKLTSELKGYVPEPYFLPQCN